MAALPAGDWADFWSKSFVSLPETQDYLENLWYLNLYYVNSEMRGAYPPHFCNGIWGFYHDFVPWNNFFHYNMQHALYPLDTACHPKLLETSHRFRRSQLDRAKEYTSTVLGKNGAVFAEETKPLRKSRVSRQSQRRRKTSSTRTGF